MFKKIFNRIGQVLLLSLFLLFILISCGDDTTITNRIYEGRGISSEINNDEHDLTQYLTKKNEEILSDTEPESINLSPSYKSFSPPPGRGRPIDEGVTLTLVAEVSAPEHNGLTLQATNITNHANFVFVSYNFAGSTYLGGAQTIQLTNVRNPRLISQVIYHNSNVSALTLNGPREVVMAMSTDIEVNTQFAPYTALLGAIGLGAQFSVFTDNLTFKSVPGYTAVAVEVKDDKIYVVSGNNAGLSIFNSSTYDSIAYIPIHDARDIAFYNEHIYVYAGTTGTLYKINSNDYEISDSYVLGGSNKPEEKSSIVVEGKFAFLAANDSGVQIFNLDSSELVHTIPNPVISGLDADSVVANSVTVQDKFIFIASGEAGIRVFKNSENFSNTDIINIEDKGYLILGLEQSANEIYCHRDFLIVASGIGGVKIIQIEGFN